jgi:mono/diheme cytochrome c family protein
VTTKILTATVAILVAFLVIHSPARVRAEESPKPSEKALFRQGAQLWPHVCGTCHKARPGGERSPAEWDTIIMHMRNVGNIPEEDAQAILTYLKAR